jgi:hypothetical protein
LTYVPALPPYAHQLVAAQRVLHRPAFPAPSDVFAYLCEMGTGKSKMILDEFGAREDAKDLRNLLVIAPKGVYANWENIEIPTHLSADLKSRTATLLWKSGGNKTFKNRVEAFLAAQDRPRVLLMNIEALSSVQAAIDLCQAFIGQRRTLMVIDESTRIKSIAEKTGRSRAVIELGKSAYARRIATGLVAPRSCLDLYSQFEFLDYRIIGFRSYYAFRSRYAILKKTQFGGEFVQNDEGESVRVNGHSANLIVGYRNEDELRDKIAPYSYRVLKEDCLDLPKKIYMTRDVEPTDEQRRVYNQLKNEAQARLASGDYVSTTMKMTTLLRMHQVLCGHVKDEDGKEHSIPSNRLKQLMELLDDCSGKAIVWSGYRYSIREIVEALRKEYGPASVVDFYGDTKPGDRAEAVRRFQNDPACRWFVSNQQTGGMGNTLTAASLVAYYSNTYDLEQRMQSEDRAHRAGLKHPVTYVDLRIEGSIDDKLIGCLRKKLDVAALISGDSYRDWLV